MASRAHGGTAVRRARPALGLPAPPPKLPPLRMGRLPRWGCKAGAPAASMTAASFPARRNRPSSKPTRHGRPAFRHPAFFRRRADRPRAGPRHPADDLRRLHLLAAGYDREVPGAKLSHRTGDRKSVVSGKSVSVRVVFGGRRINKKKKTKTKK